MVAMFVMLRVIARETKWKGSQIASRQVLVVVAMTSGFPASDTICTRMGKGTKLTITT